MNISELLVSPPRGENIILSTMIFNFLIKINYQLHIANSWKYDEAIINQLKDMIHEDMPTQIYMKCLHVCWHYNYITWNLIQRDHKIHKPYLMFIIWLFKTISIHIHDNYVLHYFTSRVIQIPMDLQEIIIKEWS